MPPDARCPGPAFVGRPVIARKRKALGRIPDLFPVHQIPGMENRKPGKIGKRGGCHIEILTDPDDIRIRIIALQNRVCILHSLTFPASGRETGPHSAQFPVHHLAAQRLQMLHDIIAASSEPVMEFQILLNMYLENIYHNFQ